MSSSLAASLRRYAFGCSELLFHPLRQWPYRGPFTKLFRQYLAARGTPLSTKMSVIAYVCIYIGALLLRCRDLRAAGSLSWLQPASSAPCACPQT